MELFNFQKKAIRGLLKSVLSDGTESVTLKAPTGSGKTVMLSKLTDIINNIVEFGSTASVLTELGFTDDELAEFDFTDIQTKLDKVEFIWLSPSTGGLAGQSQTSYEKHIGAKTMDVRSFVASPDVNAGIITFIGVDSINRAGNILRKNSEDLNWNDVLDIKHTDGVKFIVIIDECHVNDTDKSRADILKDIQPISVIKASATPKIVKDEPLVEIQDEEVIEEGLITKQIRVNHNLPAAQYETMERKNLVDIAIKQYKVLRDKYIALNGGNPDGAINPLCIIQYPNSGYGDELFEEMNKYIHDAGFSDDQIAKWITVSGKMQTDNLENITDNDSPVIFLHMKQAAGTGWDCPRAKILVKLREHGSSTFEIQTIGRIRRMPEQKHYDDPILDTCYVYTYDDEWRKEGESKGTFTETRTVTMRRLGAPVAHALVDGKLNKEHKANDNSVFDTDVIYAEIKAGYQAKYSIDETTKITNLATLKTLGKYKIMDRSDINVRVGNAVSIADISTLETEKRRRVIRENDNALNKAKEEIAAKTKISDIDKVSQILKRLFKKKDNPMSRDIFGELLELDGNAFNAFIVNNADVISKDIRGFLDKTLNQTALRSKLVISGALRIVPYELPESYDIKCDTRLQGTSCNQYKANLYEVVDTSMKTSKVESRFQKFLDDHADWWFKNGDTGEDFLSVVYVTASGKQYLFYPDYILGFKNQLWVIETKGGENKSGANSNIDPQAENKFYALKDWQTQQKDVNIGFVRLSEQQDYLYISTTEYWEDMQLDNILSPWKPIDTVLK